MEQVKQDAFDNARLEVIKDGYDRAFECINKALTADEAGEKTQALDLYKRGRQHLLRAIVVPSQGEECVGSCWESARQMQEKMQETLNNITTRLAVLETSPELDTATRSANSVSHPSAPDMFPASLYPTFPTKTTPGSPAPPNLLSPSSQADGAVGGSAQGLSPTNVGLAEHPPAYSPEAADGHLSISYGTNTGEMPLVGNDFFSHTTNSTPSPQSLSEDGEELLYIPNGVQIFFVTPEGQVSAPSYPGYLRLVKFTSDYSNRMPNRPPAFLQVGYFLSHWHTARYTKRHLHYLKQIFHHIWHFALSLCRCLHTIENHMMRLRVIRLQITQGISVAIIQYRVIRLTHPVFCSYVFY